MAPAGLLELASVGSEPPAASPAPRATRRMDPSTVRELVMAHHRFLWRLLGRLGVPEAELDDAVQQVFLVLLQKPGLEIVMGSERAFLFGVALRTARSQRRSLARRREVGAASAEPADLGPTPDICVDRNRARELLDELLGAMPLDLRVVFVLFEIEDTPTAEIAELLTLPVGTVASRLRRAREWFKRHVERLQARERRHGGAP